MISEEQKSFFEQEGYLVVENLISKSEVYYYGNLYNSFLDTSIDASRYRFDISGSDEKKEKITQIMVPSKLVPELLQKSIHQKSLEIAKTLMGDDIELDFDMLINKVPHTNTIAPWHQDAACWIDMPDKRAAGCWVAIDHAYRKNGCKWYTPKSHLSPILPHSQTDNNRRALIANFRPKGMIDLERAQGVDYTGEREIKNQISYL